eukprot:TRINITY_DN518_c0_g1_i5.p1 TRINITY_DN518_c0_g1~~TRINITY_DN518_c0_g1_i5.p1  ORF type:complete len:631 (-),score=122.51 TRINITY_DN518_c0_g1_i5:99-1991(-)
MCIRDSMGSEISSATNREGNELRGNSPYEMSIVSPSQALGASQAFPIPTSFPDRTDRSTVPLNQQMIEAEIASRQAALAQQSQGVPESRSNIFFISLIQIYLFLPTFSVLCIFCKHFELPPLIILSPPLLLILGNGTYLILTAKKLTGTSRKKKIKQVIEVIILGITLVSIGILISWSAQLKGKVLLLGPYTLFVIFHVIEQTRGDDKGPITFVGVCLRIYLVLQAALVLLRLDELVLWSWKTIVCVTWLMLLVIVFYAVGVLVILVCTLCYYIGGNHEVSQMRGLVYLFLVLVLFASTLYLFGTGFINYMDTGSFLELQIAFYFDIAAPLFLLLLTAISKKEILSFITKITTDDEEDLISNQSRSGAGDARSLSRRRKRKPVLDTSPNAKQFDIPKFLHRFSSTYFSLIKKEDLPSIEERFSAKQTKKPDNLLLNKEEQGDPVKNLDMSFKQQSVHEDSGLAERKLTVQSARDPGTKHIRGKNPVVSSQQHQNSMFATPRFVQDRNTALDPEQLRKILINSNSQANPVIPQPAHNSARQSSADKSVSSCLICFDGVPDAVFLDCGHGGICYECAKELWLKTGECYLCRKNIIQILQIELDALDGKVIKVKSSTKMVFITEDSRIEDSHE